MPRKALMSQYRVGRQSRCAATFVATPKEPQDLWPACLPLSGIIEVADAVATNGAWRFRFEEERPSRRRWSAPGEGQTRPWVERWRAARASGPAEREISTNAPGPQAAAASGGAGPAGRKDGLVAIGGGREAGTALDRRLESWCLGDRGDGGQQFLFAYPGDCLAGRGPSSGQDRRAGLRTTPGRFADVASPALETAS